MENHHTYFLIKNGENLYRIWSDVKIHERMFPTKTEYQSIIKKMKKEYGGVLKDDGEGIDEEYWKEKAKEEIQKNHETYMYGILAIQGLIERTDILGTTLRNHVNLLNMSDIPKDKIKLIRDAEKNMWISDGKQSWDEFCEKNKKKIKEGTRIVITRNTRKMLGSSLRSYENQWRVNYSGVSIPPNRGVLHQVESIRKEKSFQRHWDFKILYNPRDMVYKYDRWGVNEHERKKRSAFLLYKDEVLNFDEISIEDCEYYENNRHEREHYLSMLPIFHFVKKIKKEEQALEKEFIKYIAGQLSWDETKYKKIRSAVKWWKLKKA